MVAETEGNIVNSASSKKFLFRALAPLDNDKSQEAIAAPIVNTSSGNNILFRFQGQQEVVIFAFGLFDDGTDVSDGTNATEVKTIKEQVEYLRDTIFSAEFDTVWTLTQSRYYSSGVTGVITKIRFNNKPGASSVVTGELTFKRGRIGLT